MAAVSITCSSQDGCLAGYWSLQWIPHVLRFSKRSSNDPEIPAYEFSQCMLQVLTCSNRSTNDPQTIPDDPSATRQLVGNVAPRRQRCTSSATHRAVRRCDGRLRALRRCPCQRRRRRKRLGGGSDFGQILVGCCSGFGQIKV